MLLFICLSIAITRTALGALVAAAATIYLNCHVLVRTPNVLKFHHIVRFKASHVVMSAHAIWTKKLSAVGTSGYGFLFRFAARAVEYHLFDGEHVEHV